MADQQLAQPPQPEPQPEPQQLEPQPAPRPPARPPRMVPQLDHPNPEDDEVDVEPIVQRPRRPRRRRPRLPHAFARRADPLPRRRPRVSVGVQTASDEEASSDDDGSSSNLSDSVEVVEPDPNALPTFEPFVFQPFSMAKIDPQEHVEHPAPRSGHRIVATNQYIYMIGGYNQDPAQKYLRYLEHDPVWQESRPIFRELWRYCRTTRIWHQITTTGPCPVELISHCMCLWDKGTKLLVYGGSGTPFGQANSNKMYICDLKTRKWEQIYYSNFDDRIEMPKPGYGQAMVADEENRCIYVCGGTQGYEYSMDMHRFDFDKKTWTLLHPTINYSNLPARYRHEMALHRKRIYVLGGANNGVAYNVDNIPTFNLDTNKWSLTRSRPFERNGENLYPNPRYAFGGAQHGYTYYMFGGTDVRIELSDFWCLHLPTLQWTLQSVERTTIPSPRFFTSMAISSDGHLSLFGGVDKARVRYNDMYESWVKLPSLYRLSREAMIKNLRTLLELQAIEAKKKEEIENPVPLVPPRTRRAMQLERIRAASREYTRPYSTKIFTVHKIVQYLKKRKFPVKANLLLLPK